MIGRIRSSQPGARRRRHLALLLGWLVAVALAAIWQAVATSADLFSFSSFTAAASALWDMVSGPRLSQDVLPTVGRAALGFSVSAVGGAVVGVVIGYFRGLDPWVRPLIQFGRAIPPPLVLPLAMVVFGLNPTTEIVTVILGAVWPVLLNAIDGARRVDTLYLDTARAFRAGRLGVLVRVVLPATLPQIFVGLRIALSTALILIVIAEMLATSSGIGYIILTAQQTFQVPLTYGGVLLLGIIGWLFDTVFLAVERRVISWHLELGETGG